MLIFILLMIMDLMKSVTNADPVKFQRDLLEKKAEMQEELIEDLKSGLIPMQL